MKQLIKIKRKNKYIYALEDAIDNFTKNSLVFQKLILFKSLLAIEK